MRILFLYWDSCFCCVDMLEAMADLREKGEKLDVTICDMQDPDSYSPDSLSSLITDKLKVSKADIAFSFGFFPIISDICRDLNVIYISWTFDDPAVNLFHPSAKNSCNRLFVFDSSAAEKMNSFGIDNAWYLPMAVNPARLNRIIPGSKEHELFDADVSFVGSLYTEKYCFYDEMTPKLDEYTKGYISGLFNVQSLLYGVDVIEPNLNAKILSALHSALPLEPKGFESPEWLYSSYVLKRKLTSMERMNIIKNIGKLCGCKLYTGDAGFNTEGVTNLGEIDYFNIMPLVFKCSKINLNITLRSISRGIPLRAFDIMGCGGFLLTNYQEDMFELFEPGTDFVYWDDQNMIPDLAAYYLENENERLSIAENARIKVQNDHTFAKRLETILTHI